MQNAKQHFHNYICVISKLLYVKHCNTSLLGKQPQSFDPFCDITEGSWTPINYGRK